MNEDTDRYVAIAEACRATGFSRVKINKRMEDRKVRYQEFDNGWRRVHLGDCLALLPKVIDKLPPEGR